MQRRLMRTILAALAGLLLSYAHASPEVLADASLRRTMSLNGPWTIQGAGFQVTGTVPGAIPLSGTVTHWTKTFTMALGERPAVAFIEFGGIVNSAVVRLNGVSVGTLRAFTSAKLDVRAALALNGVNRLEVDLDDRLLATTVPGGLTEPFVPQFGVLAYALPTAWENRPGIIRDVSLVWSARPVVSDVFTSSVFTADLKRADLTVRVRVRGAAAGTLAAVVGLNDGATSLGSCVARAAAIPDEVTCRFSVADPPLWSPDRPLLEDLFVTLVDAGGAVDAVHERIGFRKIETRGNRLYLNNQPLFLRGITRHDLYADGSFVADPQAIESDLQFIKAIGANYIRAIHYPPDERVTRRADELGILLSEEIPAWAELGTPAVMDAADAMFTAMVERDYNRPSVIFWFAGNMNGDSYATYFARIAKRAKQLDATRLVSFVFDTPIVVPADIARYVAAAKAAKFDLYTQNGYSFASDALVRALPLDFPVLITEWSGSEGSNRAPVGRPGVHAFPDVPSATGTVTESDEAAALTERLRVWLPYLPCTAGPAVPCVSGLAYFNWQDIAWPALPYFNELHGVMLYSGLVYADRTPKWPALSAFQQALAKMPR